jgi:deoxyxylulose-5-phosphate synthase
MVAAEIAESTLGTGRSPRVQALGVPTRYVAHAKVAAILADLGLDADGLVTEVHRLLGR